MPVHSRTLAWGIPWTEESGRLQSIGSQRVGHGTTDVPNQERNTSRLYIVTLLI